jgi:hypothetical protein
MRRLMNEEIGHASCKMNENIFKIYHILEIMWKI